MQASEIQQQSLPEELRVQKLEEELQKLKENFGKLQEVCSELQASQGSGGVQRHAGNSRTTTEESRLRLFDWVKSPITRAMQGTAKVSPYEQATEQATDEVVERSHRSEQTTQYKLKDSIWDAAVLIGLPEMGWMGSVHTAVLLAGNVAIQTVVMLLAGYNFTDADFDSDAINDVKLWRLGAAHDYNYIDPLTLQALQTRVCRGDTSLPIASPQLDAYDSIFAYLPHLVEESAGDSLNGVVMCLLCLVCYHCSILREVDSIWCKLQAFTALPRSSSTEFGPGMELRQCSLIRYCFVLLIAFARLSVVLPLCWIGTLFLAHDTDIEDLLLNAVALEFIVNIDELVYGALASEQTKLFLESVAPMNAPCTWRVQGLDIKAVLFTLCVPTLLIVSYVHEISPMVDNLDSAYANLCELSSTDFVYATSLDGFVSLSNSAAPDSTEIVITTDLDTGLPYLPDLFVQLRQEVLSRLLFGQEALIGDDENPSFASTLGQFKHLQEVATWQTLPFDELVSEFGASCQDQWESNSGVFQQVKWLVQKLWDGSTSTGAELTGCEDLLSYCVDLSNSTILTWQQLVRFLCPATCGCHELLGQFPFIPESAQGCAQTCATENWHDGLANPGSVDYTTLPCEDSTVAELQGLSWWVVWTSQDWVDDLVFQNLTVDGSLYEIGCEAIPVLTDAALAVDVYSSGDYTRLCYGGLASDYASIYNHKPLLGLCPRQCGCSPVTNVSQAYFVKAYEIYSQLLQQGLQCPDSCDADLACGNIPHWVCGSVSSTGAFDRIFLNEDAYNAWTSRCSTGRSEVSAAIAQKGCYDCVSSPTWLCDLQPSGLSAYSAGSADLPADIFVIDPSTAAVGSSFREYYAFCYTNSSEVTPSYPNETDAHYQTRYLEVAQLCYAEYCKLGLLQCGHCVKASPAASPLNTEDWVFDCTPQATQDVGQDSP